MLKGDPFLEDSFVMLNFKNINQLINTLKILFFKTPFSIGNFIYRIFTTYFAMYKFYTTYHKMYNIIVGTRIQIYLHIVDPIKEGSI